MKAACRRPNTVVETPLTASLRFVFSSYNRTNVPSPVAQRSERRGRGLYSLSAFGCVSGKNCGGKAPRLSRLGLLGEACTWLRRSECARSDSRPRSRRSRLQPHGAAIYRRFFRELHVS